MMKYVVSYGAFANRIMRIIPREKLNTAVPMNRWASEENAGPINEGALCPKGAAMFQLRNVIDPDTREVIKNPNRITKPMVRRPYAEDWEDISWDDAIKEIARFVKDTRDQTFEETPQTSANACLISIGW